MLKKRTVHNDGPLLVRWLSDALPHGSGIDDTWWVHLVPGHGFKCENSFHVMDCVGFYDGWVDFAVYYRWDEETQQFVFKRLTTDPRVRKYILLDEEGEEYDDLPMLREYLDDCFPNIIKPEPEPEVQDG